MKIAGAPISWGVCEVPDWGYQMTPERVLTEMRKIGLTYDRSLDQWIVPKGHDIPARVLELLASEATAVFRNNCSG